MIEFGSDFHYIQPQEGCGNTLYNCYPKANLYADGRQALIHLYHSQGWKRLWLPEYFCYDVIETLKQAGLDIRFYTDYPGYGEDNKTLEAIQLNGYFRPTDAILQINFFGTRSYRSSERLSVAAIVEDHTHDLIGEWAQHSTADWCIASLRKTLPLPEGGILWSPKGLPLPEDPAPSEENEKVAAIRWEAMRQKERYLAGKPVEKTVFRAGYVNTEAYFDTAQVCALDKQSTEYLRSFNIHNWYEQKLENWKMLKDIRKDSVRVLYPENPACYPFSLILMFDFIDDRERVRKALIDKQVYPAVLWNIPLPTESEIFKISRGMLSIHCDGRYKAADIQQLKTIIESVI